MTRTRVTQLTQVALLYVVEDEADLRNSRNAVLDMQKVVQLKVVWIQLLCLCLFEYKFTC